MPPLSKSDFEPTLFGHTLSPSLSLSAVLGRGRSMARTFCRRVHRAALLPEQTAHYLDFRLQCAVSEFECSRLQANTRFDRVPGETKFAA